MTKNVGNLDRGLRLLAAIAALAGALFAGAGSVAGIVLLAAAVILLATAAVGFCPLYTLLRFDTCSRTPVPH